MAGGPVTIAYFYRPRWGHHEEFLELFTRNHWPVLLEQLRQGRFLDVRCYVPRFHGDGRADWTVMVTITFRDWAAAETRSDRAIAERLFPDHERYWAEERRRFEILDAHWDVPLQEVPLPGHPASEGDGERR
jgi:hypothetical protein